MEEMIKISHGVRRDLIWIPNTFGENQAYFDILISNDKSKVCNRDNGKGNGIIHRKKSEFSQCFEQVILDYLGEDVQPRGNPDNEKSSYS